MKAVVAAFNQEKALVGAFSVIMNLQMELFEALIDTRVNVAGSELLPQNQGQPGHTNWYQLVPAQDQLGNTPPHQQQQQQQHHSSGGTPDILLQHTCGAVAETQLQQNTARGVPSLSSVICGKMLGIKEVK